MSESTTTTPKVSSTIRATAAPTASGAPKLSAIQVLRRCEDGAWRFGSFQMTPDRGTGLSAHRRREGKPGRDDDHTEGRVIKH